MKLIQLVIVFAVVATLIVPMANAAITVQSTDIPDAVPSSAPHYGSFSFNIMVAKTGGQSESEVIPIIVNGTQVSAVDVSMGANETSKVVPGNLTLSGASILMVNPFVTLNSISDIKYAVNSMPYDNPVSGVRYVIQIGDYTKNITLFTYADWTLWAIVIDLVAVVAVFFFIRRFIMT